MTVTWMPSAKANLRAIRDYVAIDSQYYADKLVDEMTQAVKRLEVFPKSGRIVPEINDPAVREIIYSSYRIIYKLVENKIQIVAVIHGKRLLPDNLG